MATTPVGLARLVTVILIAPNGSAHEHAGIAVFSLLFVRDLGAPFGGNGKSGLPRSGFTHSILLRHQKPCSRRCLAPN